jgi:hypothetical protein
MDRKVIGWCVVDTTAPPGAPYRYIRPSSAEGYNGWEWGDRYLWDKMLLAKSFASLAASDDVSNIAVCRVVRRPKLSAAYAHRTLYAIAYRTGDGTVEFESDSFFTEPPMVFPSEKKFVVRVTGWDRLTVEVVK